MFQRVEDLWHIFPAISWIKSTDETDMVYWKMLSTVNKHKMNSKFIAKHMIVFMLCLCYVGAVQWFKDL